MIDTTLDATLTEYVNKGFRRAMKAKANIAKTTPSYIIRGKMFLKIFDIEERQRRRKLT